MTQTKKVPLRKCVGCQLMKEKKELLRVVKAEDDSIRIDLTGKMNGRGAYLCKSQDCLKKAVKGHGLERSLKCKITDAVYEQLRMELGEDNE